MCKSNFWLRYPWTWNLSKSSLTLYLYTHRPSPVNGLIFEKLLQRHLNVWNDKKLYILMLFACVKSCQNIPSHLSYTDRKKAINCALPVLPFCSEGSQDVPTKIENIYKYAFQATNSRTKFTVIGSLVVVKTSSKTTSDRLRLLPGSPQLIAD